MHPAITFTGELPQNDARLIRLDGTPLNKQNTVGFDRARLPGFRALRSIEQQVRLRSAVITVWVLSIAISLLTLVGASAGATLTTLHEFLGTDGGDPVVLIRGSNGNFYGATAGHDAASGPSDAWLFGTIFTITPSGVLTTLHVFNGSDAHGSGRTRPSCGWDSFRYYRRIKFCRVSDGCRKTVRNRL
jgi:hypothetical protein